MRWLHVHPSSVTSWHCAREIRRLLGRVGTVERALDLGSGASPYRAVVPARRYVSLDLGGRPTVRGDLHLLPFRDGSADLAILTEVLEHCHSPHQVVDETHRVLRPGGSAVVIVPFLFRFHPDPGDYYRFTEQGLRHLFRRFREVEIAPHGSRWQTCYEILYTGWARGPMAIFNHWVSLAGRPDRIAPIGFALRAVK